MKKFLFAIFLLTIFYTAQTQNNTTIIVNVGNDLKQPDSIEIRIGGRNVKKPFLKSQIYFEIDTLLVGLQPISVFYILKNERPLILNDEDKVKFTGIGVVKISILTRGRGKGPVVPYTGLLVKEFGQVTLRSSDKKLDFIIDDDLDNQGTTDRVKSLEPGLNHKIVWTKNQKTSCILPNYTLCSGCKKELTCNPKTGKVSGD